MRRHGLDSINWDQVLRRALVNMVMDLCIRSKAGQGVGWPADRMSASYNYLCSKNLDRSRSYMKQVHILRQNCLSANELETFILTILHLARFHRQFHLRLLSTYFVTLFNLRTKFISRTRNRDATTVNSFVTLHVPSWYYKWIRRKWYRCTSSWNNLLSISQVLYYHQLIRNSYRKYRVFKISR